MAKTRIQALNEASFGVINPAMAATVLGSEAVAIGARNLDTYWGNALIAGGRLTDNIDGWLARSLGVTSRAGAVADAVRDKVDIFNLTRAHSRREAAPTTMLQTFGANNIGNAVMTAVAQLRGKAPAKNWAGERMMFAQSTALIMEGLAGAARAHGHKGAEAAFKAGRRVSEASAYCLGAAAFIGYAVEALDLRDRYPHTFARIDAILPDAVSERLLPTPIEEHVNPDEPSAYPPLATEQHGKSTT